MLLAKKFQFFSLFTIDKKRLEIMLGDFAEKKQIFFDLKKQNFSNSKKSHFFKGVNPYPCQKKCNFHLDFDLIKTRLQLMLFDFEEKKKPFLALKNRIF